MKTCPKIKVVRRRVPGLVGGILLTSACTLFLTLNLAAANDVGISTIYVNKYFEIREHDAPTKYVFDGDTRIARVTGSVSANVRVQRFRVQAGWNLLSLAVAATNALAQLSAHGSQSKVEALYKWVPQAGNYAAVLAGESLAAGSVFWLKSSTNSNVSVMGPYSGPANLALPAGGHFVPSAGLEAWGLTNASPPILSVRKYNSEGWKIGFGNPLGSGDELPAFIAPGEAAFIQTAAPAELAVPEAALRLQYYHHDHLGSSSIVSDTAGKLVEENALYPFGYERTSSHPRARTEPYRFTQIEQDEENGLHCFPARQYASPLGRFLQPDFLLANMTGPDARDALLIPQKLNLYAYVRNNPMNFVDPTGLEETQPAGATQPGVATPAAAATSSAAAPQPAPQPPSAQTASASGSTPPSLAMPPDYVRPSTRQRNTLPPDVAGKQPGLVLTMPAPKFDAYVREPAWQGTPAAKAGGAGDVISAVGKVQVNGQSLQDRATGALIQPLKTDWGKATTAEKTVAITAGVVLSSVAAQALRSPEGVAAAQTLVPKIEVTIPLGKGLELKPSISTTKPEGGVTFGGRF